MSDFTQGLIIGISFAIVFLIYVTRQIVKFDEKPRRMAKPMRDYIPKSEKYYLASYRYLELKAFCRQYRSWHEGLRACYGFKGNGFGLNSAIRPSEHSDPTERAVELAEKYRNKIAMVDKAAKEADAVLAPYIILNATQGLSFDRLDSYGKRPPCGKNQFYEARQKFFWLLDQVRE
jgi:hypothetical protein